MNEELDSQLSAMFDDELPPAECELLALPDPLLAGYLLAGELPAEPHLAQAVGRIRALCRLGGGPAVF